MVANILTKRILACIALLLALYVSMSANGQSRVFAVNYPLAYFAERVVGDQIQIVFPVPIGVDPAFWVPDVALIGDFQRAALILLNGAGYAGWLNGASLPRSRLIDSSASFQADYLVADIAAAHQHGPAGKHDARRVAFTTRLDFAQAGAQAQAISESLSRRFPEHRSVFEANYQPLRAELEDLHSKMRLVSTRLSGVPLLASHPVYQYLARRYGLAVESLIWEPDLIPDEGQWQRLQFSLKRRPSHWMLWEATPLPEVAARLETLGIQVVVFAPCGNKPRTGDFIDVMQANINALTSIE